MFNPNSIALESHGYALVRELASTGTTAVLLVRRDGEAPSPLSGAGWRPATSGGYSPAGRIPQRGDTFVVKTYALGGLEQKAQLGVLQEIRLLKRLEHAYVIRYVESWWNGVGPESGRMTLVMEHADDGDLRTPRYAAQRAETHLEEILLKRWLRQMLEGLVYIHGQNVVHRDLKASNVFLHSAWRTALLGDFGISTVLSTSCFSKSCVGTPAYMSPEVIRNDRCTTAVDMWGIGVILYELLALTSPFKGPLLALVYQISFNEPDEAPLQAGGYSAYLLRLIRRLISKEPVARPSAPALIAEDALWEGFCMEDSEVRAIAACAESERTGSLLRTTMLRDGPGPPLSPSAGGGGRSTLGAADEVTLTRPETVATVLSRAVERTLEPPEPPEPETLERDITVDTAFAEDVLGRGPTPPELSRTVTVSTIMADDFLREELQRTRTEDLTISTDALEGMLSALQMATQEPRLEPIAEPRVPGVATPSASSAPSSTPSSPASPWRPPGTSGEPEEDPLEIMRRTEVFLRSRGMGTARGPWRPSR